MDKIMLEMVSKSGESILSKLGEKLVDFASSKKDDIASATFESLRSNIRSLCAMTCDVDEQIKEAELRGHKKRKRQVAEWLEQVQKVLKEFLELEKEIQTKGFLEQFFCGGGATKLDEKVHNLVEQHQHLGELVVDDYDKKGDILLTNVLVGEEFEKNLQRILKFLDDEKVSSIGIYGMGGVGKTILAKNINNRLLQRGQKSVFWTTVSQEFTIRMLQDEIAKFVGLNLSTVRNEDLRASRLNEALSKRKKKNLIFIFDDVWEYIDVKMLGDPLSVHGCRLLITTRSKIVCDQIECQKVIEVATLKENEAWKLFSVTLRMSLTPKVQDIAKSMVKLCDGLPLGIITMAGSMKGETDLYVWMDAWAQLRDCVLSQQDMNEKVFKVLKFSFDRLEQSEEKSNGYSRSQLCFLYCSLYPEDYEINRDELIRKYILEEYLDKRRSRTDLFCHGYAILNRLVKVCLLENVDAYHVKMHDLVRAMAHKITAGKTKVIRGHDYLLRISNEQEWAKELDKMSLMENRISKIPLGFSPNCPKLSTLLFHWKPLRFIPDSFFWLMKSLCILDLSNTDIEKLPESLSNMEGLKALLLEKCRYLEFVPNLGKIKKLRELELSSTKIKCIPEGMEILFDLKFLSLRCDRLERLPNGLLQKFPYLQCLYLPKRIYAPVQEIEQLKHLEEFCGVVRDALEFNRLIRCRQSLVYDIHVMPHDLNTTLMLHCYESYYNLGVSEYNFDSTEDNGVTFLAQDIRHMCLRECKGLRNELLPRLNNPSSIESLVLYDCADLECLYRDEQFLVGDVGRSALAYPTPSPSAPPPHAFHSYLTLLKITNCSKITKLGILASQLQNLEQLDISRCHMLEEIMDPVSEENGGGEGEAFAVSLPKLKKLYLTYLPRLKSLCNALVICNSIEEIELKECLTLKKLPLVFGYPKYDSPPPPALKSVYLHQNEREWWEALQVGHDTTRSLLQPFLRFGGTRSFHFRIKPRLRGEAEMHRDSGL